MMRLWSLLLGPEPLLTSGRMPLWFAPSPMFDMSNPTSLKRAPRYRFFWGVFLSLESGTTVAGPYLGAPCAAMVLESLIAKGVSRVVVVGWCGGLADHLQVGDIVIPDGAISDEGTSRNYMVMPENNDFPMLFPSSMLSTSLKSSFDDRGVT